MTEISKEEFRDWYDSIVTQTVLSNLAQRRELLKDRLAATAGQDNYQDAKDSGYCLALSDMLDISYGDLE